VTDEIAGVREALDFDRLAEDGRRGHRVAVGVVHRRAGRVVAGAEAAEPFALLDGDRRAVGVSVVPTGPLPMNLVSAAVTE
jgi:hypothetical protein